MLPVRGTEDNVLWLVTPVAGRRFGVSFWIFFFFFFLKKSTAFEGVAATSFIYAEKEGYFSSALPRAGRLTAPGPGEEVACWCLLTLGRYRPAGLLLLSFPCSSCSRVCFSLSRVLTLLFPFGSPALCLAEPSQPAAKEKPLGSWRSPLPRGHAWGERAGAKMQPRALWGSCTADSQQN